MASRQKSQIKRFEGSPFAVFSEPVWDVVLMVQPQNACVFLLIFAVAPIIVSPSVLRLSRHDHQAISLPRRTECRYLGSSQEILVLKPGYHSLVGRYTFRFFHSDIADAHAMILSGSRNHSYSFH